MTKRSHVKVAGEATYRGPTRYRPEGGSALSVLWLVGAGVLAGLAGSIAGLASLFSYPALLAAGLPATAANVTNTVALTFSTLGTVATSGPELRGQTWDIARLLPVAAGGGAAGAALLLASPEGVFERVVPFLIAAASLVLIAQRRLRAAAARRSWGDGHLLPGLFVVALYGGYFGAAAGVLMLALLLVGRPLSVLQGIAYKNVLLGVANGAAAFGFVLFGPVVWKAALPLALGLVAGAAAGPVLARRLPAESLRIAIGVAGLGLAVVLGLDAYD